MTDPVENGAAGSNGEFGRGFRAGALLACLLLLLQSPFAPRVMAQQQIALMQAPTEPTEPMVKLTLEGDVELPVLIDYVSQRLDIKFIYSSDISQRRITVHAPGVVPVSSLLSLLNGLLRMEGLAIVDSDVPGWKRIIDAKDMPRFSSAEPTRAPQGAATPVTQTFTLKNVSAQQLTTILRPFLSQPTNLVAVPETNVIVVTDYAGSIRTIAELIRVIDRPAGEVVYRYYEVKHMQSAGLMEQATSILSPKTPAPTSGGKPPARIQLFDTPHSNQIIIVGERSLVEQATTLLNRMDVSLGVRTRVYRVQHVTAERINTIIDGFVSPRDAERAYKSTVDQDGNLLIVRATDEIHSRIDELLRQIDVPVKTSESPIQFYKLKNANALDVLYTLLALQEAYGSSTLNGTGGMFPNNATGLPGTAPGILPLNSSTQNLQQLDQSLQQGLSRIAQPIQSMTQPQRLPLPPGGTDADPITGGSPNAALRGLAGQQLAGGGGVATLPGGARVSADVSTNSLVVIAPTDIQQMYARLIDSLDQRRPQVLIEAKIVAIDTSDDFSLGVEISTGDRSGENKLFEFTSFGLSMVDPATGALTQIPMTGFNGTLVDPEVADVVVKALARHTRGHVLAAPRILVNDNTTGQLESVESVPFESVNASQTVSTTSLGGDQQAGTIISVTPHINEDDHLQLEFEIEFSTFSTTAAATTAALPPPRQIDRVESTVTIPDGQTVIVGGLKRITDTQSTTGVPFLENIPLVRNLTSLDGNSQRSMSFFVFIRPIIMRDDRFADLKYVSRKTARKVGISSPYPASSPVLMPVNSVDSSSTKPDRFARFRR